eukprot:g76989.t1
MPPAAPGRASKNGPSRKASPAKATHKKQTSEPEPSTPLLSGTMQARPVFEQEQTKVFSYQQLQPKPSSARSINIEAGNGATTDKTYLRSSGGPTATVAATATTATGGQNHNGNIATGRAGVVQKLQKLQGEAAERTHKQRIGSAVHTKAEAGDDDDDDDDAGFEVVDANDFHTA